MATPIGTNVVTSISRRYILPEVTDVVYNSNPILFRLLAANKRHVRGGTQIEVPLMTSRFAAGGFYSGLDLLDVTPSDTVRNAAFDWKQAYVPVTVDGLTLIKTDSPEAIADFLRLYWQQADMEMAENLATGIWSTGTGKNPDGFAIMVDSTGTYGGLARASNAFWAAQEDATTATLTMAALQSFFGLTSNGGRHPTLIASVQAQYNRFYALMTPGQRFPAQPAGHDEQLASAGFSNLLFNGTPWTVDSHIPVDAATSRDPIYMLNEDYFFLAVSPRGDFYMEDFQTAINQDAMVAKLFWAGNLIGQNPARQGKLTNINA